MEIKKFVAERDRMCRTLPSRCSGCRINDENTDGIPCTEWIGYNLEKAAAIVEKWSAENPQPTLLECLKKLFPSLNDRLVANRCPLNIVTDWHCGGYSECSECKNAFWNTPLDEEVDEND